MNHAYSNSTLLLPQSEVTSLRSGTSTPVPPPVPTPAGGLMPPVSKKSLNSKLRNLVDNPSRAAVFAVSLTIHELSNIPQLNGKFAVKWKFRGSKPGNGDRLLEHPEQRVTVRPASNTLAPNPKLRPSSSMMSLRTHAAGGASTPSLQTTSMKQRPLNLAPGSTTPQPTKASSVHSLRSLHPHPHHSLPPSVVSRSATAGNAFPSLPPGHKKEESGGSGNSWDRPTASDDPDSVDSAASAPASARQSTYSLNTAITKPGGLPVPDTTLRPRSASRSGTAPPAFHGLPSRPSSVAPSIAPSVAPSVTASINSDKSVGHSFNSDPTGIDTRTPDSKERRGTTPTASIATHTVLWEYDIQYIIRIPLGKPVAPEKSKSKAREPSPTRRQRTLPILGGGPKSSSAVKLMVDEYVEGHDHPRPFGYVDIDLAPFAERGPTARKFLLKDSKTNATLRLSIDMRFIGGQQEWVPPPMHEGHFVNDISQLTGGDTRYKELQLVRTVSRSSDSTGSSLSGRPSSRSIKSEISLTNKPTAMAVTQDAKHKYKSWEHHVKPQENAHEGHGSGRRNIFAELQHSRRSTANTASTSTAASSFGTLGTTRGAGTGSTSSWGDPGSPSHAILSTQPLSMSPSSTPALAPARLSSSPLAEKKERGEYFEIPPRGLGVTMESPQIITTDLNTVDEPLSPMSPNEVSLMSPVLGPLSPDQSPTLGVLRRPHKHHSTHKHFLRGQRHSDEFAADLIIEQVFNPHAADEEGPFTFVPNEEEYGVEDDDEFYEDELGGLQLDAEPKVQTHHRRWSRIRRRVGIPRRSAALENPAGVSSAVY